MKDLSYLNKYLLKYKYYYTIGGVFILISTAFAIVPATLIRETFNLIENGYKEYSLGNTLANKFKIDKNRIILGSGSDQIFELICKSFLNKGDEVIVPKFSFIIYRIYSRMNGAKVIYSK